MEIKTNAGYEVRVYEPKGDIKESSILLIHGSWGGAWMWDIAGPLYAAAGYKTYALSLRGHGGSEGILEGATMEDYVEDVKSVVDEMALENPIIIGHSMGGLVALMYAGKNPGKALVVIGGSPSKEVIGEGEEKEYPVVYTLMEAGMPANPMVVMSMLPDMDKEMIMNMKNMLGMESGVARSDRKLGISVPHIKMPALFTGSEFGDSVPFGISQEIAKKLAEVYKGEFISIEGATHPGVLLGKHAGDAAGKIVGWLSTVA
ncbi:alpha/beta hydrolase [Candidatus Wolfebacteria bacterium]|nr:alpha/beta hydrolase [Candidatus Wolfebacteria bacterium]